MNIKISILLTLMLFISFSSEAQCAMCRAVIESEESGEIAKGINNGIMYLMVFPYVLIGIIGFVVYRNRKKAKSTNN